MPLYALGRATDPALPLRVYIEGDGLAWATRERPSSDPTPRRPVALQLAALDPYPNVIYLARSCQYIKPLPETCTPQWWTSERFSRRVVEVTNAALDALKRQTRTDQIELVGYSGGGAVALLVAASRGDIRNLRTVAGNLDTEAVNRLHRVSPMPESLNPADMAGSVSQLPQIHFAGVQDTVVPPSIASGFLQRAGGRCTRLVLRSEADHIVGWIEAWGSLISDTPACAR